MKQQETIYIVTCSERGNAGDLEFTVEAFTSRNNAELWIERSTATLITEYGLDSDKDVDGWFIKINDWHHTVQYDVLEVELK